MLRSPSVVSAPCQRFQRPAVLEGPGFQYANGANRSDCDRVTKDRTLGVALFSNTRDCRLNAVGWIRFNSRKFASPVALTAASPPARKNYCAEPALPEA